MTFRLGNFAVKATQTLSAFDSIFEVAEELILESLITGPGYVALKVITPGK